MGELVLLRGGQFPECQEPALGNEYRVVAETLTPARPLGDTTLDLSYERPLSTAPHQAGHGPEVGPTVPSFEQLEEGAELPRLQEVCRIDPRESPEGGDEQARILDEDVPRKVPDGGQLRDDHLLKRLGLWLGEGTAAPTRSNSERGEEVLNLPELPGVGSDEGNVGHAYQGYSL